MEKDKQYRKVRRAFFRGLVNDHKYAMTWREGRRLHKPFHMTWHEARLLWRGANWATPYYLQLVQVIDATGYRFPPR
jgi:hypothetical protein